MAIAAAPGLPAGSALSRELTSFESYALRTKINRRLYAELAGLYAELHDVVQPVGGDDSPQRVVITVRDVLPRVGGGVLVHVDRLL